MPRIIMVDLSFYRYLMFSMWAVTYRIQEKVDRVLVHGKERDLKQSMHI